MGSVKRRPSPTTETLSWTPPRENASLPIRPTPGSGPDASGCSTSSSGRTRLKDAEPDAEFVVVADLDAYGELSSPQLPGCAIRAGSLLER